MDPRLFLRGCSAIDESLCSRNNDPATRLTILETRLDWGSMTRTTSLLKMEGVRRAPSKRIATIKLAIIRAEDVSRAPASPFNLICLAGDVAGRKTADEIGIRRQ